jgi:hypothetical protein
MKNFLDLTDIDTANRLEVKIKLALHNDPEYVFSLNGIAVTDTNTTLHFDLLDNLEFRCTVDTGAVEIVNIQVNNQTILPLYLNCAVPPTSWIVGVWEFAINEPFYVWIHKTTGQGWIA